MQTVSRDTTISHKQILDLLKMLIKSNTERKKKQNSKMFFCFLFCFIFIKNKSGFILSIKLLATFSPVREQEVKTHSVCLYLNVTQTHTHCFFPWCEHVDLNRLGFVAVRLLGWTASNCHLRAKQTGALACRRLYLLNCAADSRNSQLLEPI